MSIHGTPWHSLERSPTWGPSTLEEQFALVVAEPPSLLDREPEELSADRAIDYLVEVQRAQARLAELEARALVVAAGAHESSREVTIYNEADDTERTLRIADVVREEIAAALHRTPTSVHESLTIARLLHGPLKRTGNALREGRITYSHARCIVNASRRFPEATIAWVQAPHEDSPAHAQQRARFDRLCTALQDRVLSHASRLPVGKTAQRARAAVAAIDAEGEQARRERARGAIGVRVFPDDDGLAVLLARMPVEDAARVHAAIDAQARASAPECGATLGQLRVRALVDALCGTPSTAAGQASAHVRTEINVVIDAAALVGLVDVPGTIELGSEAAEPISAQAVRELLANPEVPTALRRLITDPFTGRLLDRGRRSYVVTDAMRAFLAIRDVTCRQPGCTRPARGCEIDHATAWSDGGRTDRGNTGPLCKRHHLMKTHCDWELVASREDGTAVWRSPAGRLYEFDPPPVIPMKAEPKPDVRDGPPFPF